MRRDDLAGGNFKRREQRRRSVPLVVMALTGQGPPIRQLQSALCPLQCLDRRFFIDAQHNGLLGRSNVEANNIGHFRRKGRIVALAPGFASAKIDPVASQKPPDILNINVVQPLGEQRSCPPGKSLRRWLVQERQNPRVSRFRIDRLLARPRLVLQTFPAMISKAVPPETDNPWLYANRLGDRPSAPPGRRQQNNPSSLQITMQRQRRSATSFQHLAIFRRKADFSCFGNHPDLESRLTFQGKQLLASKYWTGLPP